MEHTWSFRNLAIYAGIGAFSALVFHGVSYLTGIVSANVSTSA